MANRLAGIVGHPAHPANARIRITFETMETSPLEQ
jgi:hypothetical protein